MHITKMGSALVLKDNEDATHVFYKNTNNIWVSRGAADPPTEPVDPPPTDPPTEPVDPPPTDPTDPPPDTSTGWGHPLPGSDITSGFGARGLDGFHYGLDVSSSFDGNHIVAITSMTVVQAMPAGQGQYDASEYCKAQTNDGRYTFAMYHMVPGSLQVSVGQNITKGTIIGTEGSSGNVTGRHLHLEAYAGRHPDPDYIQATALDPLPILRTNGVSI